MIESLVPGQVPSNIEDEAQEEVQRDERRPPRSSDLEDWENEGGATDPNGPPGQCTIAATNATLNRYCVALG